MTARTRGSQFEEFADCALVTACDGGFFEMLRGLVHSVRDQSRLRSLPIVVVDLGLEPHQSRELESLRVEVAQPHRHFGLESSALQINERANVVRPFLAEYAPEASYLFWIDADAWIQDAKVIAALRAGAAKSGFAAIAEEDPAYTKPAWLMAWKFKHGFVNCGLLDGLHTMFRPMINAGVLAFAADAPHWEVWRRRFAEAMQGAGHARTADQFSINRMIWVDGLPVSLLASVNNWICNRAAPVYDQSRQVYCRPTPPHDVIRVMHLAGHLKTLPMDIETLAGDTVSRHMAYSAAMASPFAGD